MATNPAPTAPTAQESQAALSDDAAPPVFTPYGLRGMSLINRIVMSPLCMYSATDGVVGDWHMVHLGSRAIGGAGLVIAEMTAIHPDGRISAKDSGIWDDSHTAPWRRVVDFVHHNSDAMIGLQLGHAGRKGDTGESWKRGTGQETVSGFNLVAPSAIAFSERTRVPREITLDEIAALPGHYVRGAERALAAGFDMIELHCAHGYLLSSFISPLANKRSDHYGGTLENRMRLPIEVFRAVRGAWPEDRPIAVRISAVDWTEGGHTIADAVAVSRLFRDAGADIIDVSSGMVTNQRLPDNSLYQVPFAEQIRAEADVPTMAVGNIETGEQMNHIIASGRADLCVVGRGHMYDPYLARHIARELGYDMKWPDEYARGARFRLGD
jgi:anthraniloyl-CoA monooxygenase